MILRFIEWLSQYGETSYDFQSYYASDLARSAKALYYKNPLLGIVAVSPMVFSEAFVPSAKSLFWKRQRFPIADAHYAMGFALLSKLLRKDDYYTRAVHFLEVLKEYRAMKAAQASLGEKKAPAPAPRMARPGQGTTPSTSASAQVKALKARFNASHKESDGIALMNAILGD